MASCKHSSLCKTFHAGAIMDFTVLGTPARTRQRTSLNSYFLILHKIFTIREEPRI